MKWYVRWLPHEGGTLVWSDLGRRRVCVVRLARRPNIYGEVRP